MNEDFLAYLYLQSDTKWFIKHKEELCEAIGNISERLSKIEETLAKQGYSPNVAVRPGDTLLEFCMSKGWNCVHDAAWGLGIPDETYCDILDAQRAITPALAEKFAQVFGTSAKFWLNLEANYRKTLADLYRKEL